MNASTSSPWGTAVTQIAGNSVESGCQRTCSSPSIPVRPAIITSSSRASGGADSSTSIASKAPPGFHALVARLGDEPLLRTQHIRVVVARQHSVFHDSLSPASGCPYRLTV